MNAARPAPWSFATNLMHRTVCPECEHMHRRVIRGKCECCDADCAQHAQDREGDRYASQQR